MSRYRRPTEHRQPVLVLAPRAWQMMLAFVQLCPDEINGWAYVRRQNANTFFVGPDDVFITDQVVSIVSAEVDGVTMAMVMDRAEEEDRLDQLRLQWHSHVHGDTYFSATDTATMDAYGHAGAPWMISLVLNKYGDARARLDLYTPMRVSTDVPIMVQQQLDPDLVQACEEAILRHVERRPRPKTKAPGARAPAPKPITPGELTKQEVHPVHLLINPS